MSSTATTASADVLTAAVPRRAGALLVSVLLIGVTGCAMPTGPEEGGATSTDALAAGDSPSDDCRLPSAYPFELDPTLSVTGYGLNTNDNGIQDYGELDVDCGGAGREACVDVPLDVEIVSVEAAWDDLPPQWGISRVRGTINGREFEMIVPEFGPTEFPNADIGIVNEHPSRRGHPHAPNDPFSLGIVEIARAASGVITIAMRGVTGGHPYTFSAQESVLAARFLREHYSRDHVIVVGVSYGGAAAMIDAALYPEHFDGVVAGAAPYSGRQFVAWSELNGLMGVGSGMAREDAMHYSELDSMTMAAAQNGLTIESLNLTRLGNARVPTTLILGEIDGVWMPGNDVEETRRRMEREGIDWVEIYVEDEAGHGGPGTGIGGIAFEDAVTQMFDRARTGVPGAAPPVCARPRERDRHYEEYLRPRPVEIATPEIAELWSTVTQVEHTSPHASASAGNAVYSGSAQGYVTRRELEPDGTLREVWRASVGRMVKTIATAGPHIVVGSLRGLAILDAATGRLVRETTDIGTVNHVVVGDLIPDEEGLEIAARVDYDLLRVTRLETGELLGEAPIGTGGAMLFTEAFGQPLLLAALSRGHVAGFAFRRAADGWRPVARWLSEYLANDLQAIAVGELGGEPVLLAGGRVRGGLTQQLAEPVEDGCAAGLKVVDRNGQLIDEIGLQGCVVRQIQRTSGDEWLVSVGSRLARVNLEAGNAQPWPSASFYAHDARTVQGTGGFHVVTWLRGGSGRVSVLDRAGSLTYDEAADGSVAPAMDVFRDPVSGRTELSILSAAGRQWRLARYDLVTGEAIGGVLTRDFENAARRPNRLVRTAAPFAWESYEVFLNDGALFQNQYRVATRCGRWYTAASLDHEQLYHAALLVAEQPNCALDWRHVPGGLTDPGPILFSERVGTGEPTAGSQRGALRFVDLDGPESHFLMSTMGGNLALFDVQTALTTPPGTEVSPAAMAQVGGQMTSLAVKTDADRAIAVLGSWRPAADGTTVQVVDPRTLEVLHAFDAGPVLAVAAEDVDGDDVAEIVVGTQDGRLAVYSQAGELRFEWSEGDLNVGEGGSLHVTHEDGRTLVAFPVLGGVRVVELTL